MYDHVSEWLAAFKDGDDLEAATSFASTLTPTQLAILLGRLEVMTSHRLALHRANLTVLSFLGVPRLNVDLLNKLCSFLFYREQYGEQATRALLMHPLASEHTARMVSTFTHQPDLISSFGWLTPAADHLLHSPSSNQSVENVLDQLEGHLWGRPPQLRLIVATLGLTWNGSVAELLATADGILI